MIGPIVGGSEAASAQEDAANTASQTQLQMFNVEQQDLQPYMQLGQLGNQGLTNDLSSLTSPVNMNMATLDQTPGYQFALNQGLKSVNNQQSALGLANSGASQKAAANYATGLASNTYQQQFNNAVTNQTNTYNRLMGLTNIGQSSAAGVGAAALQTGSSIGSNMIGSGNALASMWNADGSSVANTGSTVGALAFLNSGSGAAAAAS